MNVRGYGTAPYRVAVVHGGPGAPGSVAGLARGIAEEYGVLEPLQSKSSIDDLVDELKEQLEQYGTVPVVLIGHSWGAWLAGLVAARHPDLVQKLILIACGPLDARYVPEIGVRREKNMMPEVFQEYRALLSCLHEDQTPEKDRKLARLGAIAGKADGFDELEEEADAADALPADGELYARIMPEAMCLRESGRLLSEFRQLRCPVVLIQGDNDSHPWIGVTEPFSGSGVSLQTHILEHCGHTPWRERHAKETFYQILFEELQRMLPP